MLFFFEINITVKIAYIFLNFPISDLKENIEIQLINLTIIVKRFMVGDKMDFENENVSQMFYYAIDFRKIFVKRQK